MYSSHNSLLASTSLIGIYQRTVSAALVLERGKPKKKNPIPASFECIVEIRNELYLATEALDYFVLATQHELNSAKTE